ncbi:related to Cell division control protein 24 [Saccharomycodes ludwigii]|uniref:Related to Cell division control protein 24 n=1 Tax=Saccharomycodes ludwigii TaxID=36035 RepID=A0A376B5X6_9ASCO|nr:related to Cell division control protein 24 [Saccharomycodes ludwigii]
MNLLNNTHSTISLPSFEMNNTSQLLNKRVTEKDSLYYICLIVKKRLEQLPLLKPYLNLAYSTAELLCERQALLLAQRKQQLHQSYDSITLISSSNSSFLQSPGNRISSVSSISMDSMDSEKISTTSSNEGAFVMRSSSHSSSSNLSSNKNDLLTFSIGILPITTDCDPVTQLSNLFQQGSPLCIIFNAVKPQHKLTVVSSDDIKVCKKSIYDFICACKMYLTLTDEELFTISDIFSNSTEKLIKILDVIKTLLDSAPSIFPSSSAITYTASIANSNTDHGKIVREFLETERKYVYDLEILYNFSKQLVDYNIINTEELYMLFPNLHEVIEFQRRFLISLEVNAQVENEMQRIGSIFVHSQNFFKLYEPWSIGQTAAIDYIASLPSFNANASHLIIKNKLELQSFLLKPVQRLCKYPLLLKQLLQTTPIESPNYKEMELAVDISKSVAKNINENQRRTENHEVVKELYGRVNNWKGYHISKFGELLFYDKVKISSGGDISDSDREFEVFLFEKIIVLFSESGHYVGSDGLSGGSSGLGSAGNSLKKTASSSLILKKKLSNTVPTLTNGKKTKLDLRGRIMIININKVTPIGNHNLNITWESPKEQGNFVLKFRNEETRDNWNQCLQDLCKLYRAEFGTADTGSRQNSFIQSFSNININNNRDRKSTRLNSSHTVVSRMPSSA